MALCIPFIEGPISEISQSILIKTALPGAMLTVSSIGTNHRTIVEDTASGGEDRLFLSAVPLEAGDILVVKQTLGGDSSETNPKNGFAVQAVPRGTLPGVVFNEPLQVCGEYVWVSSAIPGAKVEVRNEFSGALLGEYISEEGNANFKLSRPIPDKKISVRQVIPSLGLAGPPSFGFPVRPYLELKPPKIKTPILACESQVLVSGVIAGATVILNRSPMGIQTTFGFPTNENWVPVGSPLKQGEILTVKQQLAIDCQVFTDFSPGYAVEATSQIQPPVVASPLCSGADRVKISNLIPTALVKIYLDGVLIGTGQAPNTDTSDFQLDGLGVGMLSATQELCSHVSQPSVSVRVEPGSGEQIVRLLDPLYECARAVFVDNVKKGTSVQVWKKDGEQTTAISNVHYLYETEATIAISPLLKEGDYVWIEQWSCGHTRVSSISAQAMPIVIQRPYISYPLYHGNNTVEVKNAVPGGLIQVYLYVPSVNDWAVVGSGITKHGTTYIKIFYSFYVGQRYKIRQLICESNEQIAQFSAEEIVTKVSFTLTPGLGRPSASSPSISAQWIDTNKWVVTGIDFSKNTSVRLSAERFDTAYNLVGTQSFASANTDAGGSFTANLAGVSCTSGEKIRFTAIDDTSGKEYTTDNNCP